MSRSLSIVVPVHNAQATLARQVTELLDLLPELSSRFEIMIVDDASTDMTEELALDLAREFPQIRVIHHTKTLGTAAAVKSGLGETTGEIVFVHGRTKNLSPNTIWQLWQLRDEEQLVMARADAQPRPLDAGLMQRLADWGQALKTAAPSEQRDGGLQMIRREAVQQLIENESDQGRLSVNRSDRIDQIRLGDVNSPKPNVFRRLRDLASGE